MTIEHRVPLVGQITDNLCWFAAFQMLEGWYNGILPKRPPAFTPTQLAHLRKLKPSAVPAFANLMGLTIKTVTPDATNVEGLLRVYGPIWYPAQNNGYIPSAGTHHVVVIRGIRGTDFLINDPSPVSSGHKQVIPVATFFRQLPPIGNQFAVMLKDSKPDPVAIFNDLKVK
jgi:Papain-like cysteine protease AvrRpt2